MSAREGDETTDAFQRGAFRLVQGRAGHRAGMDALLLASLVPDDATGRLLDLGSGSGAVAFAALARCEGLEAVLAERDVRVLERAERGIDLNGWRLRARTVNVDVTRAHADVRKAGLEGEGFDYVLSNPPFNGAGHRPSPDAQRRAAHADADLDAWLATAWRCVRSDGLVGFVVRPDALPLFLRRGGRGVTLRWVHPRADEPASRLLVETRKSRRTPLTVVPPLVVHEPDGAFGEEARAIFEGA